MLTVKLIKGEKSTNYLKKITNFEFDNLLQLIFELFQSNPGEADEVDDILYDYITSLGYESVHDIPEETKKELEDWYFELLEKYHKKFDEEKLTYLLLGKIVNGEIIVLIDNIPVKDIRDRILLQKNSIISFINRQKINDIKFTTI